MCPCASHGLKLATAHVLVSLQPTLCFVSSALGSQVDVSFQPLVLHLMLHTKPVPGEFMNTPAVIYNILLSKNAEGRMIL